MSTRLLCYRYSSASSVYDLIENGTPEIQIRVTQKERKFNEDSTQQNQIRLKGHRLLIVTFLKIQAAAAENLFKREILKMNRLAKELSDKKRNFIVCG